MSLKEAMYIDSYRSSVYAKIRTRARDKCKKKDQKCEKCGYDKHVEVCHVKSISLFSLDSLISEINDDSNLKILCPNCHWEFDNLRADSLAE